MSKALNFENITYFYPRSNEPALKDVSIFIDYGEFVVIAGPSGGGKSTLCRIAAGLIPQLYGGKLVGKVFVDGIDISKVDARSLIDRVGVVFQNPENQIVNLVVEEELVFALENLMYERNDIKTRVLEISNKLGIDYLRNRSTFELSGGETQKVVLGSVLVVKPKILILDEPLAHLDPPASQELLKLLYYLNKVEDKTIIIVEHRLSEILRYASRLVVLDRTVVADGDPREVLKKLDNIDLVYGVEIPSTVKLSRFLNISEPALSVEELVEKVKNRNLYTDNAIDNYNDVYRCSEKIIEVENLWYIYDNGVEALKEVYLDICRGEFVAIIGSNGSGKTTLIKHFNGLLKPTKGRVKVLGMDTVEHSVAELSRFIGIAFQNPLHHFFKDTVYEEVLFTAKIMGVKNAEERTSIIIEKLGLKHLVNRSPYEISAGEQRRLAIASVLVYDPEIIVLDEPTAGIDFRHKLELLDILIDIWRKKKTIVLTTHDIEFLALTPVNKVIVLDKGRVVGVGNPKEVFYNLIPKDLEIFVPQIVRFIKRVGLDRFSKVLNVEEFSKILKGSSYG
jgi:energy-coupling factor transport system ATP-binding protein